MDPKSLFWKTGSISPCFEVKTKTKKELWPCPWSPCSWKDSEDIGWTQFLKQNFQRSNRPKTCFWKTGSISPGFNAKKRTKNNNSEPVLEALVHGKIRKTSDGPNFCLMKTSRIEWAQKVEWTPKVFFFWKRAAFPLFWGKKTKIKTKTLSQCEPVLEALVHGKIRKTSDGPNFQK